MTFVFLDIVDKYNLWDSDMDFLLMIMEDSYFSVTLGKNLVLMHNRDMSLCNEDLPDWMYERLDDTKSEYATTDTNLWILNLEDEISSDIKSYMP